MPETLDVRGGRESALGHYRAAAALGEPDAHYFLARSAADAGDWGTVGAELAEFDAAVGGIAKSAMAGDFSQRVTLEGKEGVIRNLAEASMRRPAGRLGG